MPGETDHGPSTLPAPELNPLVNPVLGQHMGRWAEVYFTNPPEKREKAVLELLRELEGTNTQREDAAVATPTSVPEQASEPVVSPTSQIAVVPQPLARCPSCGRGNPAPHKFCGMCGARLAEEGSPAGLHPADVHLADRPTADRSTEDRNVAEPPVDEPAPFVRGQDSQPVAFEHGIHEQTLTKKGFSLKGLSLKGLSLEGLSRFRIGRDDDDDDQHGVFDSLSASGSYRVLVGVGLAIMISALTYVAWRGAQGTSQGSHHAPPSPPAVTQEPATAAPALPSTSQTNPPDRTPSANHPGARPSRDSAEPIRVEAGTGNGRDRAAQPVLLTISPAQQNPQTEAFARAGAEELAMAQRYLNGAPGQERNSAEGAKWLWKAIAKHNSTATLLLADLYLKGDGVSKNCDQARVLLDAAALKGVKDAAERLRHLQVFGCE